MTRRLQRYRLTQNMRDLVSETTLSVNDFIMPIFVHEGLNEKKAVAALPGIYQWSLNDVLTEVEEIVKTGIKAVILFGIPTQKDAAGSQASNPNGIVHQAITLIKHHYPDLIVIADCCLCEYTDHGECGIPEPSKIYTDKTLNALEKISLSYAEAGVDIIAPSGMVDLMISQIRSTLDQHNFHHVAIMSYASKFASSLYGPFREAAGSALQQGDRKHHQLNPTQRLEALEEARLDEEEGADFLMVKPALFYLDIIREINTQSRLPIAAYQVSGEYAMLMSAAKQNIVSEKEAFMESFIALKRAGTSLIISYYSKTICQDL